MDVDLRSDTVTRPTEAMRSAMCAAPVGDDAYGEDPTVNRLQEHTAELFGMGAALFLPSGTMANQVAVQLLMPPGSEVLCDADAHVVSYESAGAARNGGVQTRTVVPNGRGLLDPAAVEAQLRPAGFGTVVTGLLWLEQTHNRGGGSVYPLTLLRRLCALADGVGAAVHCDGARIWNASVVPLDHYGALFSSMTVSLSKSLGAPVGSLLLLRDVALVEPARALRRRLGGGMRQVGMLAAAGLFALHHHVERLAEDHTRAQVLAAGLAELLPGAVAPADVETNIVAVDLRGSCIDAPTLAVRCRDAGVLIGVASPRRVRLVTHLDVDNAGIDHVIDTIARAVSRSALFRARS